jgi:putative membrane protein
MKNQTSNPLSLKPLAKLFVTGFSMGSADIVPGVSGGTIALLFGVYEKLINSIKIMTGDVVKLAVKGKFGQALKVAPLGFLMPLGLGLVTAIFVMSSILQTLLHDYPVLTWSVFFGLVLASTLVISKEVKKWQASSLILLAVAALATYLVVGSIPMETPATPLAFFLSGAVGICAMILPGVSGSFLLILLGKYTQVLNAVTNFDVVTLGIFMLGAGVGIATFSRVLSYLFDKHHNKLIAVLTGMLIGSLRKIWPWKEVVLERLNSHGEMVPVVEKNIVPGLGTEALFAVLLSTAAFLLVWKLSKARK